MTEAKRPDFDTRARSYDTLRPTDNAWWEVLEHLVDLGDLRGRRVLDVGCGTGQLAAALTTEAGARVWGIDTSEEMLAVARKRLPVGVGVRAGAAERLPFRDGWFDRVTMSLVLHLLDRQRALPEARRVVRSDGRIELPQQIADWLIAISTFHPDHFESYWLNPYFPSIREIDENRFPTLETMRLELRQAGFPKVEDRLLVTEGTIGRDLALARIRGRHISTFDFLTADELAEGTARAEHELPDVVAQRIVRLVVIGHAR